MRRHWRAANRGPGRRAADRALAWVYLLFMGVAAILAVLLATVLLVVALADYLPIPRIDKAVR